MTTIDLGVIDKQHRRIHKEHVAELRLNLILFNFDILFSTQYSNLFRGEGVRFPHLRVSVIAMWACERVVSSESFVCGRVAGAKKHSTGI